MYDKAYDGFHQLTISEKHNFILKLIDKYELKFLKLR